MIERYHAAACQTAFPCPRDRSEIPERVARMRAMARHAVTGYEPFFPVRLVAFPEFAHAAPVYASVDELAARLALPVPNDHVDDYARTCRELGCWMWTGTFIEVDDGHPDVVFNTTCLVGPDGYVGKYRKVNPWIPWEVHASPHDVGADADEAFPVFETEIGRLACAICYDWLFPETLRAMALRGAEVLVRVSAYMDPWGATPPMDWWTLFNRARAAENTACVLAVNQGASLEGYPPFSWPGGSMVVDHDGRVVAQADPGEGEKIVVGPVDLSALRAARRERRGHDMRAHHRASLYADLGDAARHGLRPAEAHPITGASIDARIAAAKTRLPDRHGGTA